MASVKKPVVLTKPISNPKLAVTTLTKPAVGLAATKKPLAPKVESSVVKKLSSPISTKLKSTVATKVEKPDPAKVAKTSAAVPAKPSAKLSVVKRVPDSTTKLVGVSAKTPPASPIKLPLSGPVVSPNRVVAAKPALKTTITSGTTKSSLSSAVKPKTSPTSKTVAKPAASVSDSKAIDGKTKLSSPSAKAATVPKPKMVEVKSPLRAAPKSYATAKPKPASSAVKSTVVKSSNVVAKSTVTKLSDSKSKLGSKPSAVKSTAAIKPSSGATVTKSIRTRPSSAVSGAITRIRDERAIEIRDADSTTAEEKGELFELAAPPAGLCLCPLPSQLDEQRAYMVAEQLLTVMNPEDLREFAQDEAVDLKVDDSESCVIDMSSVMELKLDDRSNCFKNEVREDDQLVGTDEFSGDFEVLQVCQEVSGTETEEANERGEVESAGQAPDLTETGAECENAEETGEISAEFHADEVQREVGESASLVEDYGETSAGDDGTLETGVLVESEEVSYDLGENYVYEHEEQTADESNSGEFTELETLAEESGGADATEITTEGESNDPVDSCEARLDQVPDSIDVDEVSTNCEVSEEADDLHSVSADDNCETNPDLKDQVSEDVDPEDQVSEDANQLNDAFVDDCETNPEDQISEDADQLIDISVDDDQVLEDIYEPVEIPADDDCENTSDCTSNELAECNEILVGDNGENNNYQFVNESVTPIDGSYDAFANDSVPVNVNEFNPLFTGEQVTSDDALIPTAEHGDVIVEETNGVSSSTETENEEPDQFQPDAITEDNESEPCQCPVENEIRDGDDEFSCEASQDCQECVEGDLETTMDMNENHFARGSEASDEQNSDGFIVLEEENETNDGDNETPDDVMSLASAESMSYAEATGSSRTSQHSDCYDLDQVLAADSETTGIMDTVTGCIDEDAVKNDDDCDDTITQDEVADKGLALECVESHLSDGPNENHYADENTMPGDHVDDEGFRKIRQKRNRKRNKKSERKVVAKNKDLEQPADNEVNDDFFEEYYNRNKSPKKWRKPKTMYNAPHWRYYPNES